ncbi:hypothetical protein AU192_04105 [Mycobacterium lehmannii]|uniref:Uncharacterized protein n=1 Tax=Mycobacterium lehmannii TaxID=2048550 RepID=A0A117JJ49_9MYCO|nr:hypothetical protein [Mycobacterium lehmannii]KUI13596.1 hypothetical protein AU192_04105 [Mycobacterium lehmannii]
MTLPRDCHVAYADDPHTPIGVVTGHPSPGLVEVTFYGGGMDYDIMLARHLVPVSEWRLLPRPGRLTPYQRQAIAACPWCDTLGLVDGQDGEPVFCDHRAVDAATHMQRTN